MNKSINFDHNPAILNDFLVYLKNTKQYSLGTVKEYESDLTIFFKFILQYKDIYIPFIEITLFTILKINTKDIIAFLVYLNYYRNDCSFTRQRKLYAIKSFFKWILIINPGLLKENPASGISKAEPIMRLPKYLNIQQAKEIQSIFTLKNSKYALRNNTIIILFLTTGIRISELIGINIKDINLNEKYIKIVGKGNRERIVYLNESCKKQLEKYLRNRVYTDEDPLFISSQKKRISKSSIENICKQAYKLLGIEGKHYSVHTLRHTAATILYKYTNDILLLQSFLGHASLKSTEIYTHVYNSSVKEAVEKNPLSNFIPMKKAL